MSQSKKKRPDSRSVEKTPNSKAIDEARKRNPIGYIITASVFVVVILIIVFGSLYLNTAPFRRTIITGDGISIRMDYFLKRARLQGNDSLLMFEVLTNELLIKLEAPRYGIEVSPEDINQELRQIARGESETISEGEFKEWYRQQLNETKLSDSEYKELVATSILTTRLYEYQTERMPTVVEHVYLHAIVLETYEDAEKVRARWEAGEDFASLAREVSIDTESGERGGDLGWFPRGILASNLDYTAFSQSTDNVSQPIPYVSDASSTEEVYFLLMVSERADAREVDEDYLPALRGKAFEDWLSGQIEFHEIKYDFNSEIDAWIKWQLAKE